MQNAPASSSAARRPRSSWPGWRSCPGGGSRPGRRALRRQAQVPDDRDAGPGDPRDRSAISAPPSSLTASQPASAMKRPALRIAVSTRLVAHVGHVADQPGVGRAASHRRRMADHVVHGHRQGAVVAEHGHAQAVADEDHVDAGLFLQVRRRVVVAGQPGDGVPSATLANSPGRVIRFRSGTTASVRPTKYLACPRSLADATGRGRVVGPRSDDRIDRAIGCAGGPGLLAPVLEESRVGAIAGEAGATDPGPA